MRIWSILAEDVLDFFVPPKRVMNDLLLLLVAAVFFGERGLKHRHTDHIKLFSVLVKLKLRAFKHGGVMHLLTFR